MSAQEILDRLRPEFVRRSAPFSHKPSALLALLHAVQEALGYVPEAGEAAVAEFLGIGRNQVHEAVTFYTLFRRTPYGRYHLQVCRTLSCDACGADAVKAAIRGRLGNLPPRTPTPDGMFSWEEVECLGCCDLAPALQVNSENYRGPMDAAKTAALLDELAARPAPEGNGHGG